MKTKKTVISVHHGNFCTGVDKKLPKYIAYKKGSYQVSVWSKTHNMSFYVGRFDSLPNAITARDKYIIDNQTDITLGILPRGISFNKKAKKYVAFVDTDTNTRYHLGYFATLSEAIKERNDFIDSWK